MVSELEFQLIPVSREHYNNQVRIHRKKGRSRKLKYDETEIEYFAKRGIDIKPNIRGVEYKREKI